MGLDRWVVERFYRVLVEEIRRTRPEYLDTPFTVAEIYQALVPYRTHRDRVGVELNGDYEEALLHLLAGDAEYLQLDSPAARDRIRRELVSNNPNTGVFREFAALTVRLDARKAADIPMRPEDLEARDADAAAPDLDPVPEPDPEPDPGPDPELGLEPVSLGEPPKEAAGSPSRRAPAIASPAAPDAPPPPSTSEARMPSDCPECRKDLPQRDSLRFCPFCGIDVLVTACSECDEELDRSWKYCIACGTPAAA